MFIGYYSRTKNANTATALAESEILQRYLQRTSQTRMKIMFGSKWTHRNCLNTIVSYLDRVFVVIQYTSSSESVHLDSQKKI